MADPSVAKIQVQPGAVLCAALEQATTGVESLVDACRRCDAGARAAILAVVGAQLRRLHQASGELLAVLEER